VRKFGPIEVIDDLNTSLKEMATIAETLATERLVPQLLAPISRQITSNNA